jgi:hypothetical protein
MDKHIIVVEEFKELARPVSIHIDEDEVQAFIREAEDMYIIPAVGYDVCKRLTETKREELSDDDKILLSGGEWTDVKGNVRYCNGLKKTMAYFVYARMSRSDGSIIARTGFMSHNDEYASHVADVDKRKRYNDIMEVAEQYLSGCLSYWKSIKGDVVKPVRGSRARIHVIGD